MKTYSIGKNALRKFVLVNYFPGAFLRGFVVEITDEAGGSRNYSKRFAIQCLYG